jgi:hypothetical protein
MMRHAGQPVDGRHPTIGPSHAHLPAYLLRNPPAKHEAWADLRAVLSRLGRTPPEWALKGQKAG